MKGLLLLAATPLDPPDFSSFWQRYFASRNETTLMLFAIGGVVVVVMLWAIFIRKRKDEDSRRYSYRGEGATTSASSPGTPRVVSNAEGTNQSSEGKRRRRRRRRRAHRPRNPTLAEAGGLPPVRAESFTDDPP